VGEGILVMTRGFVELERALGLICTRRGASCVGSIWVGRVGVGAVIGRFPVSARWVLVIVGREHR